MKNGQLSAFSQGDERHAQSVSALLRGDPGGLYSTLVRSVDSPKGFKKKPKKQLLKHTVSFIRSAHQRFSTTDVSGQLHTVSFIRRSILGGER